MILVQDSEEGGFGGVSRDDRGLGRMEGGVGESAVRGEEEEEGPSVTFVETK